MRHTYPTRNTQQGRDTQQEAQRKPLNTGKISGATKTRQASDLDRPEQQIEARARVQRYMNDPDNKQWTDEFMVAFEKSNQGQEWYQARYNMGKPIKPINKEDNSNVG